MAFKISAGELALLTEALNDNVVSGVNPNTLKVDERAWLLWTHVCERHKTSPLRTAEDARDYPARNAHLLACLAMHAFTIGQPKNKARSFIKPASALAYPLAITRVFKRWGVHMPGFKLVKAAIQGMARQYLALHGPGRSSRDGQRT